MIVYSFFIRCILYASNTNFEPDSLGRFSGFWLIRERKKDCLQKDRVGLPPEPSVSEMTNKKGGTYFKSAHGLAFATYSCHAVGFSSKIYTF